MLSIRKPHAGACEYGEHSLPLTTTVVRVTTFAFTIVNLLGALACHHGQRGASAAPVGCPSGVSDTTMTGVPRTQRCGERARLALARLIREMPSDTSTARLTDLIDATRYPDQHLLDAALDVAANHTLTRAARIAALSIVAHQVFDWTTTAVVTDSMGGHVGVTPYSTNVARCMMASVNALLMYPMPNPPASAFEHARRTLAPVTTALDEDPIVRDLVRCILRT